VKTEADLVEAANRSFVDSFAKLAAHGATGEVREKGGVFAFVTGHPVSLFNGCVVTEPATAERLEAELDWVRGHELPYRAWIAAGLDAELGRVPLSAGLERDALLYPGMVLHPVPEPPEPPPGVQVLGIELPALDEFRAVAVDLGSPPPLAGRIFTCSFAADADVRLFVGSLDGRPVGTSIAIRTGDVCGVYNVATVSEARRRGVGGALTWAAVAASSEWGCDTVVLQSTEMARSLYGAMGFRTVVEYATYLPADPER
jgi:ribosomal protein S18 acetylase RimI-like enzyme